MGFQISAVSEGIRWLYLSDGLLCPRIECVDHLARCSGHCDNVELSRIDRSFFARVKGRFQSRCKSHNQHVKRNVGVTITYATPFAKGYKSNSHPKASTNPAIQVPERIPGQENAVS